MPKAANRLQPGLATASSNRVFGINVNGSSITFAQAHVVADGNALGIQIATSNAFLNDSATVTGGGVRVLTGSTLTRVNQARGREPAERRQRPRRRQRVWPDTRQLDADREHRNRHPVDVRHARGSTDIDVRVVYLRCDGTCEGTSGIVCPH